MDPYGTHLEALVQTALDTTGPILELGCGDYSTPVLQAIARSQGRAFKVQASNKEWAARFDGVEIVEWDKWKPEGTWGMVFLDSEEGTWLRVKRIPQLAGHTNTIVLHDADITMTRGGWAEAARAFPNITLYEKHKPWTAVLKC